MAKRIEPLSSRAQIVAKATEEKATDKTPEVTQEKTATTVAEPVVETAPVEKLPPPRQMRGSKSDAPKKKKRSFFYRVWRFIQFSFAMCLIIGSIAGYFIYEKALEYYAKAETYDLKKLDDLSVTSTFLDVNGEELGRIFVEDRIVLKPEDIPLTMRQAALSAEDRRYYQHGAIDYVGILRALYEDLGKKNQAQGGSTIEQQLAKHLIGDSSRTLDRKLTEAFVAFRIERALTKDQILNYYLNTIYFGKGYFGIESAARGYFGKDAKQMTVNECALLAGIIRAPNILNSSNPNYNPDKALFRRNATLKQMLDDGYINSTEYVRDVNTPIHILPSKPSGLQTFVMAAAVKEMEQILSKEGTEEMPQGLTVRTNIDLRLQRAIEDQMNLQLTKLEAATPVAPGVVRPPLQGAALVADLTTGRVQAWIGGRDFTKSQFDHISMAHRENGALLEPLIYALGFDRLNLNPATMINASYLDPNAANTPADLALGDPSVDLGKWFLSVQDALALGNKPAATRVGLQIGAKDFREWLSKAGVEQGAIPDKPNVFNPDPMTLGDMVSLYQVLGDDGLHHKLKIIQSIQSRTGEMLYEDIKSDRDEPALLNSLNDEQMTLTLQNALRTGPARALATNSGIKSEVAGMPGYSEGYRDAWFVGYTPSTVAGVWIGYDGSAGSPPQPIGSKETALRSAVPLWAEIMRQTEARQLPGSGSSSFQVPDVLSKVEIDRSTGALRGLAGLAPAPNDIFVYLKKDQVAAAGTNAQSIQAPREWSDWITTMFNEADETGLMPDDIISHGDARPNLIPALAEYKMPGLRGDILSVDGVPYATMTTEKNLVLRWPDADPNGDEATVNANVVKWMRSHLDEVQEATGMEIPSTDADLIAQYRTQRYQPYTVLEHVTPDQMAKIQAAGLEGKGFSFQTVPLRYYPHGPILAHALGTLARDQQRNKGKYLGGDVIYDRYKGASGLEEIFNQELTGKDGTFKISTTPDGYARSAVIDTPASYGDNVRLTIDSKIQAAVERALANSPKKMKAAVMIDIKTGDVVAMASQPAVDPNMFLPSMSPEEWKALNDDELHPLLDRVIHAQYPPGSSFKTVTSIAAMRAGVFDPNWVYHGPGYIDIGNLHILFADEKGDVSYLDAFTHSWNTYFMTLGMKVGRDMLIDTARSLNLGSLTGIILKGELPGLIPDPEFVKRVHGRDMGPGDVANTAIGQGDVLVTPLQMADLMAAVANGGTVYKPRLVKQVEDRNGNVIASFPIQTDRTGVFEGAWTQWLPDLKAAMINVVDDGTAMVVHRDDMKIAAKTGTAQVGTKEQPRQIAWLSGYIPADNPQYSFSIMVEGQYSDNHGFGLEDGLLGGREAGGIAKDIFDQIYPLPGQKAKDAAQTVANDNSTKTDAPATNGGLTTP